MKELDAAYSKTLTNRSTQLENMGLFEKRLDKFFPRNSVDDKVIIRHDDELDFNDRIFTETSDSVLERAITEKAISLDLFHIKFNDDLNPIERRQFAVTLFQLEHLVELRWPKEFLNEVPNQIGQLHQLQYLDVSYNNIAAEGWFGLEKVPNLKRLDARDCNIQKLPEELAHLKNLQHLDLSGNRLSTEDFKAICNLSNLKTLILDYCQIKEIPDEISQLTQLEKLVLTSNRIVSKEISDSLFSLSNLKELFLDNNWIEDLPKEVEQLTNLEKLVLSKNNLLSEKGFRGSLKNLTHLKNIKLYHCNLHHIPKMFAEVPNLHELNVSQNKIVDIEEFVDTIALDSPLQSLDLSSNKLQHDSIPNKLGQLENLKVLDMTHNDFGKLPQAILHFKPNLVVGISDNVCFLSLPSSFNIEEPLNPVSGEVSLVRKEDEVLAPSLELGNEM